MGESQGLTPREYGFYEMPTEINRVIVGRKLEGNVPIIPFGKRSKKFPFRLLLDVSMLIGAL